MNHKVIYIVTYKITDGSRVLALAPHDYKSSAHWCSSISEALNCMYNDDVYGAFVRKYRSIQDIENNFKILAAYTDEEYPEFFI